MQDGFGGVQGGFLGIKQEIHGQKRQAMEAGLDDSDSEGGDSVFPPQQLDPPPTDGPKPGKKTKGRVKIKMEFIENKLRRYTTFSKRKTGIMKKVRQFGLTIFVLKRVCPAHQQCHQDFRNKRYSSYTNDFLIYDFN